MPEFGQSEKENVDYVVRSASDKLDGTEGAGRNSRTCTETDALVLWLLFTSHFKAVGCRDVGILARNGGRNDCTVGTNLGLTGCPQNNPLWVRWVLCFFSSPFKHSFSSHREQEREKMSCVSWAGKLIRESRGLGKYIASKVLAWLTGHRLDRKLTFHHWGAWY